jgi:hypothetical protein
MDYIKYPRTYHLNWSKGVQSDDKIIKCLDHFIGKEIVALEKLDGENTTLYSDYYHARSIDSKFNFTRSWVATMHSGMRFDIPNNLRLVVENMWGKHSIRYENLNGYAYLLSIWKDIGSKKHICLNYDETLEWADKFDLPMPKELYRGVFDEVKLRAIANSLDDKKVEGYVIRLTDEYLLSNVNKSIAKYVREGHVQPDSDHWLKNAKKNGDLIKPIKPYYMS